MSKPNSRRRRSARPTSDNTATTTIRVPRSVWASLLAVLGAAGYVYYKGTLIKSSGMVVLQGSATYLSKAIELDKKVTARADYLAAIDKMFDSMAKTATSTGVNLTNLANGMFAVAALDTHNLTLDAPYVMSQRQFTDNEDSPIFTQLFAGYVLEHPLTKQTVIVDLGSGEIKYYAIVPKKNAVIQNGKYNKYPFTAKEIAKESSDALIEALAASTFDRVETEKLLWAPLNETEYEENWERIVIGTEAMRDLTSDATFGPRLGIIVIDAKTEAKCELSAVTHALQHAVDLPPDAANQKLLGNLAWGNGSCQGTINGNFVQIDQGLNAVKALIRKVESVDYNADAGTVTFPEGFDFREQVMRSTSTTTPADTLRSRVEALFRLQ